ncbi:OmpA family protein [Palleronia sp. LCG004]|uniref:OmpA family protein n=1 Tax=Palleronia sp. LCG004 TaxID=3079304 RepID=UPI00294264F6|nr:OmpA family protein [Palleronia sp. LCG004]WOI56066.1 OmpA family protein [Palleronia sp. LCG004]
MRLKSILPLVTAFAIAGAAALFTATFAATQIEDRATGSIRVALAEAEIDWAQVTADGLRLEMTGTAPDEAARFRALSVAGEVVDSSRIADAMEVAQTDAIAPPDFSVEILRQQDEVTLIGLIPAETDRQALLDRVGRTAFNTPIVDLLEQASYPAPEGWSRAVDFGIAALDELPSAKISIREDAVAITSMAESEQARDRLERRLESRAPNGIELALEISAPRPVVSPYLLRMNRNSEGTRFQACTAPDDAAAAAILAQAHESGVAQTATCRLGLGVPSPEWADAATRSIAALGALEGGRLTLSDLAIRLEAVEGQDPDTFESVVSDLESDLPEGFTLTAILPDETAVEPELGPAEFTVTRSPEGQVQMRGRLGSEQSLGVVSAFAQSLFGVERISSSLDIAPQVPQGWAPRVMVALDSLSLLTHGSAIVSEQDVAVSGSSGVKDASDEIARILTAQLGDGARFEIDVSYDERADPTAGLPTPEECVERVNAVLTERQITFDPGSAVIDAASRESVDAIADIVRQCDGVQMEVGGFTDSQGRDEMNRELSQERADALLAALMARRVLTSDLIAKGYGEENPIADNSTAEGREANRRLEFRLLGGDAPEGEAEDAPDGETGDEEASAAE